MPEKPFWSFFQQTRKLFKEQIGASNKHDIFGWSMYQQTRPLYVPPMPLPAPPPPPTLTWPRKIYVATRYMGVYYTDNFSDPSIQPTWTRVNDGLATLNCYEFHLDPFNPEYRQYVLIETGGILYRREGGGAWQVISNNAIREALGLYSDSSNVGGFYPDPTIQGRIWLTTKEIMHGDTWQELWSAGHFAFKSDDYGTTWTPYLIVRRPYNYIGTIRARGDWVWSSDNNGVGVSAYMLWSSNGGVNWGRQCVDSIGLPTLEMNPLCIDFTYYGTPMWSKDFGRFKTVADYFILHFDIDLPRSGAMWYDPDDVNHQRLLHDNILYITNDKWATKFSYGTISIPITQVIAPWAGDDKNRILISTKHNISPNDYTHVISALYGEDDLTPQGIGGLNTNLPPYGGSIPRWSASGGPCDCGIQAVKEAGYVYV